jgi:O-antigen/teichoic acid export membrane protein
MESNHRTSLLKKNIYFSFALKGWSGAVQLLLVPLTLFCLGNYENGIWMTISSLLLWVDHLDIGLGNGLRNKLASQLAQGDIKKARESVSSTFFMLILVMIPLALLCIVFINTLDFYALLNIDKTVIPRLNDILMLSVACVSGTFIFKFIGNIYLGLQLPAVNNALVVCGQTLTLILIYLLKIADIHSLMLVAIAYTLAPLLVYLCAWPITFNVRYPHLKPSIAYFNKNAVFELFNIGIKFFILQIAGLILFTSSNVMISHFFSPEMVTPYQIAYRYFSFTMMIFTIIAMPFWSATTDAYEKKDYVWIAKSIRSLQKILLLLAVCLILMVIFSKPIYYIWVNIWVGNDVFIPLSITICMAFYMMIIISSLCYSYFLNGFGILRLQIIFSLMAAVVYFPLAWLLSRWLDVTGMLLALCLVNIPGAVVNMLQFHKIMNGTGKGIWIK